MSTSRNLQGIYQFVKARLGSMALIDDAPADTKEYARKDNTWVEVVGGGGGGGSGILDGGNASTTFTAGSATIDCGDST